MHKRLAKQKLCIYIKLKYEKCIYKDLNKKRNLCIPEINNANKNAEKHSPQSQSIISLHFC